MSQGGEGEHWAKRWKEAPTHNYLFLSPIAIVIRSLLIYLQYNIIIIFQSESIHVPSQREHRRRCRRWVYIRRNQ